MANYEILVSIPKKLPLFWLGGMQQEIIKLVQKPVRDFLYSKGFPNLDGSSQPRKKKSGICDSILISVILHEFLPHFLFLHT